MSFFHTAFFVACFWVVHMMIIEYWYIIYSYFIIKLSWTYFHFFFYKRMGMRTCNCIFFHSVVCDKTNKRWNVIIFFRMRPDKGRRINYSAHELCIWKSKTRPLHIEFWLQRIILPSNSSYPSTCCDIHTDKQIHLSDWKTSDYHSASLAFQAESFRKLSSKRI